MVSLIGTANAGRFGGHGGGGHFGGHFSGGAHFGGGHFGGGVRFGGGVHVGGTRFGGGIHVGAAARWGSAGAFRDHRGWVNGGGHVWVGGRYWYHPFWGYPYYGYGYGYSYYYPEYVPSYYGTAYAAPTYAGPAVAAVVAPPPPPLPRFGIGVFGGAVGTSTDTATNTQETDLGLLARFRLTDGLLVEGELGKTSYNVDGVSDVRVDRRLGASLVYEIGARNRFAPFVLAGGGVQEANTGGSDSATQDYGEIGAGLRFAITPHVHIAFDLRAGTRSTVSSDQMTLPAGTVARGVAPPTSDSGQSEDYTRGRLSAILYF